MPVLVPIWDIFERFYSCDERFTEGGWDRCIGFVDIVYGFDETGGFVGGGFLAEFFDALHSELSACFLNWRGYKERWSDGTANTR